MSPAGCGREKLVNHARHSSFCHKSTLVLGSARLGSRTAAHRVESARAEVRKCEKRTEQKRKNAKTQLFSSQGSVSGPERGSAYYFALCSAAFNVERGVAARDAAQRNGGMPRNREPEPGCAAPRGRELRAQAAAAGLPGAQGRLSRSLRTRPATIDEARVRCVARVKQLSRGALCAFADATV